MNENDSQNELDLSRDFPTKNTKEHFIDHSNTFFLHKSTEMTRKREN
jgi:hypothetical protein